MKRKTAKEILADSFRELAQSRKADRITVKDITENCGYSSATFYRQFREKYDLIAWDYSRRSGEIMDRLGVGENAWREMLREWARFFEEDREYLANLFLHTTGMDSFLYYMTETHDEYMQACVRQGAGVEQLDEKTLMYIHAYCHGNVALTCDWVLGRYAVSAEELAEVFERTLPEPLRECLYR